MTVEDRGQVLTLVTEAVAQGSRQHTACEMVGVAERTLQRWQRPEAAIFGRLRALPPLQRARGHPDHLTRRVLACPLRDGFSHQRQHLFPIRHRHCASSRPFPQIKSTFFGE